MKLKFKKKITFFFSTAIICFFSLYSAEKMNIENNEPKTIPQIAFPIKLLYFKNKETPFAFVSVSLKKANNILNMLIENKYSKSIEDATEKELDDMGIDPKKAIKIEPFFQERHFFKNNNLLFDKEKDIYYEIQDKIELDFKNTANLLYYEEEKTPFAFLTLSQKDTLFSFEKIIKTGNFNLDFINNLNKDFFSKLEIDPYSFSKMKLINNKKYITYYDINTDTTLIIDFTKKKFYKIENKQENNFIWKNNPEIIENFEKLIEKIKEESRDYRFIMFLNGQIQKIKPDIPSSFYCFDNAINNNKDHKFGFIKNHTDETIIPCIFFNNKQSFRTLFNNFFICKNLFNQTENIHEKIKNNLLPFIYKGNILKEFLKYKINYKEINDSLLIKFHPHLLKKSLIK